MRCSSAQTEMWFSGSNGCGSTMKEFVQKNIDVDDSDIITHSQMCNQLARRNMHSRLEVT